MTRPVDEAVSRGDPIEVRLRLFAGARDLVGHPEIRLMLPPGATARVLLETAARAWPDSAGLLSSCRVAAGGEFLDPDARVPLSAELALIPPVSGG